MKGNFHVWFLEGKGLITTLTYSTRKGEGSAGRGTKRKRMPICNGLDRGYYNEKYFIVEDTQLERVLTSKGVETEKAL
jgi:hypothetical protein